MSDFDARRHSPRTVFDRRWALDRDRLSVDGKNDEQRRRSRRGRSDVSMEKTDLSGRLETTQE